MVTVGCRTTYAGVTFRSRLEAMWAGEFDRQGVAWEYEPVTLTDGRVRYTPDFRLANRAIYVEVKPASAENINPNGRKLIEVGIIATPVIAMFGSPSRCRITILSRLPHQDLLPARPRWPRGECYPSIFAAYVAALAEEEATMPATLTAEQAGKEVIPHSLPTDAEILARLADALDAFRATGDTARRAIRYLSGLLDQHSALPLDDELAAHTLALRFLSYRYGPASYPHRSIRDVVAEGWGKAVQCRLAYRQLSQAGRAQAEALYGPFTDGEQSDRPLWLLAFPQGELDALDMRAKGVGIGRGIPRLVSGEDG